MYLELDLGTPKRVDYLRLLKVKNTLLKNWPRTTVDGIEVFDRLEFYWGDKVRDDSSKVEIYKMLGTSVEELANNDYKGVKVAYLEFKPEDFNIVPQLGVANVADYINTTSEIGKEYTVRFKYSQRFTDKMLRSLPIVKSSDIVAMVEAGYDSKYVRADTGEIYVDSKNNVKHVYRESILNYNTKVSDATFMAIIDKDDTVYSSKTKVLSKRIVDVVQTTIGKNVRNKLIREYTIEADIEYSFTRLIDVTSSNKLCSDVLDIVLSLKPDRYSFYSQVRKLIRKYNSVLESDVVHTSVNVVNTVTSYYYKTSGVKNMTGGDVATKLLTTLDSGYEEKSQTWYEKLAAPLLFFIIVLTAIVLAAPTGGTSFGLLAAASFFGQLALYISLGSLVLIGLARWAEIRHSYVLSMRIGAMMVMLQTYSQYLGYVSMGLSASALVKSGWQFIKDSMASQFPGVMSGTVQVSLPEKLIDIIKATYVATRDSIVDTFSSESVSSILSTMVKWLNTGFSIYTKWIDPIQKPIAATESSPGLVPDTVSKVELTQKLFDDYSFIDMNNRMENTVPQMTTPGLMQNTLSKYYDA